jgi:hypothetical protein
MPQIHLKLAAAPPHTYAFVFGAYCTKEGDFSQCETAAVKLTVEASPSPSQAMALGGVGKATSVLVCTVRRAEGHNWDVCQMITAFPAPQRNFVDSFDSILGVVSAVDCCSMMHAADAHSGSNRPCHGPGAQEIAADIQFDQGADDVHSSRHSIVQVRPWLGLSVRP